MKASENERKRREETVFLCSFLSFLVFFSLPSLSMQSSDLETSFVPSGEKKGDFFCMITLAVFLIEYRDSKPLFMIVELCHACGD